MVLPLGEELAVKFAGDLRQVSMASWSYDHTLLFTEKPNTLFTISFQTIKAAVAKPVKSLGNE